MHNIFDHFILGEQAYTQTIIPVCEQYCLTYAEMTVLLFLANNPAHDTASDISKYRNLAKSHVSVTVRSLEERGLITKEYHGENRRSVHLSLTEQAASIVNAGREAQNRFGELLFEGVTDDEKRIMNEILKKVDRNVEVYVKGVEKSNAE